MTDIENLIERVRQATGPDRRLEEAIVEFAYDREEAMTHKVHDLAMHRYTASVDATLALVERLLPGWGIEVTKPAKSGKGSARIYPGDDSKPGVDRIRKRRNTSPRHSYRHSYRPLPAGGEMTPWTRSSQWKGMIALGAVIGAGYGLYWLGKWMGVPW